jgi:hypothetical protein
LYPFLCGVEVLFGSLTSEQQFSEVVLRIRMAGDGGFFNAFEINALPGNPFFSLLSSG